MSKTTMHIQNIIKNLGEISGLDGEVADIMEELDKAVTNIVKNILKNYAACLECEEAETEVIRDFVFTVVAKEDDVDAAENLMFEIAELLETKYGYQCIGHSELVTGDDY